MSIPPELPEGTGAADLDAFDQGLLFVLLGPWPTDHFLDEPLYSPEYGRLTKPRNWPEDLPGAEFFYRGLARRWTKLGGSEEAAVTVRRKVQTGEYPAVVGTPAGRVQLDPSRFEGEASRLLWWTARASGFLVRSPLSTVEGDIYLIANPPEIVAATRPADASHPTSLPAWWPKPGQSMVSWVSDPVVGREAERRLRAAGVAVTEAAKARAMEAMAGDAERSWSASSIEVTRRKTR
jgi:hypothetical protein